MHTSSRVIPPKVSLQHSFSGLFNLEDIEKVQVLDLGKTKNFLQTLQNFLKENPEKKAHIRHLVFSKNDLDQNQFEQLLSGITAADFKELSSIDLSHNKIKNLTAFKTWLEKTPIQEIDLGFNELQDDSIEIICELKKSHPNIHLNGNYFTAKGIQNLQKNNLKMTASPSFAN